jgi:integrase
VSLYKRCSCDGWRCDHAWWYRFRLNGRNCRGTTQTALKRQALDIEARERSRILEGRHGIRRQPDITFRDFSKTYIRDHAELHKRDKGKRDQQILVTLTAAFGHVVLHEITSHRIESWKRERLGSTWVAHGQKSRPNPIKPATVNRELALLKAILTKAVEWGKLIESPAKRVKLLRVDNRRTRVLSPEEERALVAACQGKFKALVTLALLTGARLGELLGLQWTDVTDDEVTFLETKNGRTRRLPLTASMKAVFERLPKVHEYVFTNPRTAQPYTSIGNSFERALERAEITTGDVSFHTLRHTALSRMIAEGHSDHTVMAISGHSTTRMLERYTHPTQTLKVRALETGSFLAPPQVSTKRAHEGDNLRNELREAQVFLRKLGGRRGDRTRGLRIANARRKRA